MDLSTQIGLGAELTFEGRVLRIAPISNLIRAEFELWLKRSAWATIDSLRGARPAHEVERMSGIMLRDLSAHVYAWGGETCNEAVWSLPGQRYLWFLRLKAVDPLIDEPMAAHVHEAIGWERAAALMIQADAPKARAPEAGPLATGGSPPPTPSSSPTSPGSCSPSTPA